jgi:hypothetical protein
MVAVDKCNTPRPEWGHVANYVTSYPITKVTTLQPFGNDYTNAKGSLTRNNTRIGPGRRLHLNDLADDCATVKKVPWRNRVQEKNYDPGCNPILEWRTDLINLKGHPK